MGPVTWRQTSLARQAIRIRIRLTDPNLTRVETAVLHPNMTVVVAVEAHHRRISDQGLRGCSHRRAREYLIPRLIHRDGTVARKDQP